jgi:hypothetical protein
MIDFSKRLVVSGQLVTINPYTERRAKQLIKIQEEIDAYIKENPETMIGEIREKKAEWHMKKAQVLWTFDKPVDIKFFLSEDFEASLLQESEAFFLSFVNYL